MISHIRTTIHLLYYITSVFLECFEEQCYNSYKVVTI